MDFSSTLRMGRTKVLCGINFVWPCPLRHKLDRQKIGLLPRAFIQLIIFQAIVPIKFLIIILGRAVRTDDDMEASQGPRDNKADTFFQETNPGGTMRAQKFQQALLPKPPQPPKQTRQTREGLSLTGLPEHGLPTGGRDKNAACERLHSGSLDALYPLSKAIFSPASS